MARDDHAEAAIWASCGARDEKTDWTRIPSGELHDSMAFLDAEGMRFHLPAYMIGELTGESNHSPVWTLTTFDTLSPERFALLSSVQRTVVRAFLQFVLADPDPACDRPKIQHALDGYWSEPRPI
jgi:hypothetical protein